MTEQNFNIKPRPISTRENDSEEEILREARERAAYAFGWWSNNFDLSEDDVRFTDGGEAQWDKAAIAERTQAGRPVITVNALNQYLDQVQGQQRQAKPGIQVIPANDAAHSVDFAVGSAKRKVRGAELYEGIVRGIEYESNAERHYDKAFQHATDGGFGWLRVVTEYASGHSFDQKLRISHLRNRWSALIDPDAEQPDYADAGFGFVFTSMSTDEFQKRYPNAKTGDLGQFSESVRDFWAPGGKVTVAEYMSREPEERELVRLVQTIEAAPEEIEAGAEVGQPRKVSAGTHWLEDIEDILPELEGAGFTIALQRKVVHYRVFWRLITAWDVLEKKVELPFSTIPLVPVLGKEKTFRDGSTIYRSLIRDAKEPQQIKNVFMASALERIMSQPRSPYIAEAEAIEGFEGEWIRANVGNPAVLRYNRGSPPPQRQPAGAIPTAELQIAAMMTDEMKASVGMYDSSLGNRSNETSGVAIRARQGEADNASFTFVDNLAMAVARVGRLLLEGIPKIYDSERVLRILGEDGAADWVTVNEEVTLPQTGQKVVTNALGTGEWDIVIRTGPAYNTQREAAVDMLIRMLQTAGDAAPLILDKIAENSDWPGAREIAKRLKRNLAQTMPHLLEPQEIEDLDLPKPDPDAPPSPEEEAAAARMAADTAIARQQEAEATIALQQLAGQAQAGDPEAVRQIAAQVFAEMIAAMQQGGQ